MKDTLETMAREYPPLTKSSPLTNIYQLNGAANPSGSYKLLIVDSTPLQVKSFFSTKTSNMKKFVANPRNPKRLCTEGVCLVRSKLAIYFAKYSGLNADIAF
jgi:hypothetical protein